MLLVRLCCMLFTNSSGSSISTTRDISIIFWFSPILPERSSIAWRAFFRWLVISSWVMVSLSAPILWTTESTVIKSSGFRRPTHEARICCMGATFCSMAFCFSLGSAKCCAIIWVTSSKKDARCLAGCSLSRCSAMAITACRMPTLLTVLAMRSRYSENRMAEGILFSSINAITLLCMRIKVA